MMILIVLCNERHKPWLLIPTDMINECSSDESVVSKNLERKTVMGTIRNDLPCSQTFC